MVPERQKVWTDRRTEWMDGRLDDAKTISLQLRWGVISHVNGWSCDFKLVNIEIVLQEDGNRKFWECHD